MKENTSLVHLEITTDDVNVEAPQQTVKALHLNDTVQVHFLYCLYPEDVKKNNTFIG